MRVCGLRKFKVIFIVVSIFLTLSYHVNSLAKDSNSINSPEFDDFPLKQAIETPSWFKLSLLELNEDIADARNSKKSGIILYFGQRRCPYCKKFVEDNFSKKDVVVYVAVSRLSTLIIKSQPSDNLRSTKRRTSHRH